MSTASKTKSRDKKVMNDSQKTPGKASGSMGASTGVVAGAYNPLLGTFQSVESLTATGSSSLHNNGRFRHIDESDSTGADCDSVSNNGSWSGESEDHKEKVPSSSSTAAKQEIIPGADNDKREKMRLKNERKHQRQKEKRAQELHERCCQYLMSRKLEVLAQQLVAMGIAHERATYALMLNEGKLEESINWLFDDGGAKVADKKLDPTSGNLKLDISQELGRIVELETKYKCSKQDVERAVVTAEGDIEKAEESLRRQKQDQSVASRKAEDISDSTSVNSSKVPSVHTSQKVAQLQPNSSMYPTSSEVALDRKSVGYPRGSSYVSEESGNQSVNSLDRIHMKLRWMKLQQDAALDEKKRMPYQQTPLPRTEETHYAAALSDQFKRHQHQEMREPVMVMQQQQHQQQRSQSANTNVLPVSTMNPSFTGAAAGGGGNGWYPANRSEAAQSNGYVPTRTLPPNDLNSNLMYQQLQYQQYQGQVNNSHRMAGASAPVAVAPAASLGLFSGFGSVAASGSSGLDWNTDGSIGHLDYNNIDWSLDKGLACPRPSQQQYVAASSPYEAHMNGRTRMMANGNGMGTAMGVQDTPLVGNGREWTSPFEGKDLFSLSRQFVPPSL